MQRYLQNGTPMHVVPSGIDFELFRPQPRVSARDRLGLAQGERLVLFVGNPELARKRYGLASRAVALLPAAPPTRLIVGWHVPHVQMPDYMAASDALAFTSAQEASPNAVKEALACDVSAVPGARGDVAQRLHGAAASD